MSRREWALLFAAVLLFRLAHQGILWVEEAYPMAAAGQVRQGLIPYRDFFFDKPPLAILFYLIPSPLRVLGAAYVTFCAFLMWRFSGGNRLAPWLTAFFFTFDTPSAATALSPDLLMFAPHAAAVWFASRGRAVASGVCCGIAAMVHAKGLLVIAAALIFLPSPWIPLLGLGIGALPLAIPGCWEQIWVFGRLYSADSFISDPLGVGLRRSGAWAGFHAVLVIPAVCASWKERNGRWLGWLAISAAGVALGLRFFPRYYFQLLPVTILLAVRGLSAMPARWRAAMLALLLIPAGRFLPRYVTLALHGDAGWADTAMNRDARMIAAQIPEGATVLVWGYRPDILVYSKARLGAPFLDSQPLTGVLADRHLTSARATASGLAQANRQRLATLSPEFVVDGLGPYNPALAITAYPDLREWLSRYEVAGRTGGGVIYRLSSSPAR
jgi:hypothetical protein